MIRFITKRLLLMAPILLGSTLFIFVILRVAPGDPVDRIVGPNVTKEVYENIRINHGLDKSIAEQYVVFLKNLSKGDLGNSILQRRPVIQVVKERIGITLKIGSAALLLSFLLAIPIGTFAAIYPGKPLDYLLMTFSMIGISMPTFWFASLLLYFLSYRFRLFPISGYETWQHYILPVVALGMTDAATSARMVRSSMLEVLGLDYIRTARAKGVSEKTIIFVHALKNALQPIITLLGMKIGWLFGGSAIVEIVFSIPGIGLLLVDSIFARDYPVVQGTMLILVVFIMIGNLLADVIHAIVDPRITFD